MTRRTIGIALCWLSVLLWMIAIFSMSAQPAPESSEMSASVTEVIVSALSPSYADLTPEEQTMLVNTWNGVIRKVAHFTEYMVLGVLLSLALLVSGSSTKGRVWLTAIGSLVYAAGDEWHQHFVEGRSPGVGDVLLDFGGALTGILLFSVLLAFYRRHFVKKS